MLVTATNEFIALSINLIRKKIEIVRYKNHLRIF
jgi:hypothetical protein